MQTYPLRQKLLRPNDAISACMFSQDKDQSSAHFGAFVDDEIVAIVSVFLENDRSVECLETNCINSWQIRAMATDESVRGKGYAIALLKLLEMYVVDHGNGEINQVKEYSTLIWCNARSSAVGFYAKAGYNVSGKEFEIEGVGPHFRMRKIVS